MAQSKKSIVVPTGSPGEHRRGFMKGAVLIAIAPLAMAQEVRSISNPNPFIGTWKLNLAKSKFDPGPPVRSRIVTVEAVGDALRWRVDQVDSNGKHATVLEMPKPDGKDYPRTSGLRKNAPNTISMKRIDPYTLEETLKKDGQVETVIMQVVSKDGRTRTATHLKGTNASGQEIHDVLVFDRQ